jgi:hypothetical protein
LLIRYCLAVAIRVFLRAPFSSTSEKDTLLELVNCATSKGIVFHPTATYNSFVLNKIVVVMINNMAERVLSALF